MGPGLDLGVRHVHESPKGRWQPGLAQVLVLGCPVPLGLSSGGSDPEALDPGGFEAWF